MEVTQSFYVERISSDLWRFSEGCYSSFLGCMSYVDAYLLVGSKRAVLIDALQREQPIHLKQIIRSITDLPVTVLITHGHHDHAGPELRFLMSDETFTCSFPHVDIPIAQQIFAPDFTCKLFQDIADGEEFPLGNVTLQAVRVSGHTPGSTVFIDRENRRVFTGDALGGWLMLPHSCTLSTYCKALEKLESQTADITDGVVYSGHLWKEKPQFTVHHFTHVRELCEKLVSGELCGEKVVVAPTQIESLMGMIMQNAYVLEAEPLPIYYNPENLL